MKIFCLKDTVSGIYGIPILFPNEQVALRALSEELNSPDCGINHANDMQLISLGNYNEMTGEICSSVDFVVSLSQLKESEKNERQD